MKIGCLTPNNGELDAGPIMEGDMKAITAEKFLGGARIEARHDHGSFDTHRGNLNKRVDVGVSVGVNTYATQKRLTSRHF
jgi:hypothetical protein